MKSLTPDVRGRTVVLSLCLIALGFVFMPQIVNAVCSGTCAGHPASCGELCYYEDEFQGYAFDPSCADPGCGHYICWYFDIWIDEDGGMCNIYSACASDNHYYCG